MNLFAEYQKKIKNFLIELEKKNVLKCSESLNNLTVELPPKNQKNDISCNASMILSKLNNVSPLEIGELLKKELIIRFKEFKSVELVKPGFLNINFQVSFWNEYLNNILKLGSSYGSNKIPKKKIIVEFVSANPTGPLHVGHCRGAILGDVISNLLIFNNQDVVKEYYVNDYGSQIKNFVTSVYYRIIEILEKKKFPSNKDLYPGEYIVDIAKKIINSKCINDFKDLNKIYEKLSEESLKNSIELIKSNLNILGIKHDNFFYESDLVKKKSLLKIIDKLKQNNYIYTGSLNAPKGEPDENWKKRDQLLFRSTEFGDDVDRSLQKADGTWTYFANDIAYHSSKVERNFDLLINILGSDHAGYIKRITSATKALSQNKIDLICKVSQLVKLFKKGKPFKMSKRKGDYITVDDLLKEVGKDSVRFMMLNRSNDVELDFDFEKVTEKSKENPVFYVQYAYARINSVFNLLKIKLEDEMLNNEEKVILNTYEQQIVKKIAEWPKCVEISSTKLEPHRISFYLYDLVTLFHSYWNLGNTNPECRFVTNNKPTSKSKVILLKTLAIVIKNGMNLLGVSTPKSM